MLFLQCIQHTGCFRFFWHHGFRKCRCLITECTDLYRFSSKWSCSVISYRDGICGHWVIRDLNPASDQGRFGFIFPTAEADAGTFINQTCFMMEKGLSNDGSIQKRQCPGVTPPFLKRSDPFRWNRAVQAFIIFSNTVMGYVMIVFFQIYALVSVHFLQSPDLMDFGFPEKGIHYLMELFTFPFGFSTPYRCVTDGNAQLSKGKF